MTLPSRLTRCRPALFAIALAMAGGALGCGNDSKPAADDGKAPPPTPADGPTQTPAGEAATESDAAATGANAKLARLLEWLDPAAIAAAAVRLPDGVAFPALVSVFGIPPRGEGLLEAAAEVQQWLPSFVPKEHPPSTWLGEPALAVMSAMSTSPTVIRPLTQPRDAVAAILDAGQFDKQTLEGFDIWYPKKSFPYRVAILDEAVVAFIPAREPGSGLSPLTAGRDMPSSDMQQQMEKAVAETPQLYVELFAAGPMMHFDLDPPLTGARFELVPFETGGVEGRILLQPERDPGTAVDVLEKRVPVGETDRIAALAKAVAYQLDGPFVVGVLQLPAADVKALGEQ